MILRTLIKMVIEKKLKRQPIALYVQASLKMFQTVIIKLYNQRDEHPTQDFCARVLSYDVDKHEVMIEQRNYFKLGDQIEFFSPHHENVLIEVKENI